MKHIRDFSSARPLLKCLGSDIRLSIIELLSQNGPMQMKEISDHLGITSGSLTPHIKMLAENELISIQLSSGKHGVQRICSVMEDKLIIDFETESATKNIYTSEIGVGQYSDYKVLPTCGISTADHLIGLEDDPKFFASPERFNAGILWFTEGYVEYMIPNFLEEHQIPVELLISFEIASEAPGICEDWPSDIHFYMNGTKICEWTTPGDFGEKPGIYTPKWWNPNWNQYGQLKFLSINDTGTYIDGMKRSDITLKDLNITAGSGIKFKMAAPPDCEHRGGMTLYGRSFGNYDQDIKIRMQYQNL